VRTRAKNEPITPKDVMTDDVKFRAPAMTEEHKEWVVQSSNNMRAYILWGASAMNFLPEQRETLKPTPLNWRVHNGTLEEPNVEDWTLKQIAGFYWYSVSIYNERRGYKIQLPNWGMLLRNMKSFLLIKSRKEVYKLIRMMTMYFHLIQYTMEPQNSSVRLNETSMNHMGIRPALQLLMEKPSFEIVDLEVKANDWLENISG